MLLSWPGLLCVALLLLVVIILSSAGGPAAFAPPDLASTNYSCTIAPGQAATAPTAAASGSAALIPATAAAGDYAGITLNVEQMKVAEPSPLSPSR